MRPGGMNPQPGTRMGIVAITGMRALDNERQLDTAPPRR
jgi:hypothetical protein